MMRTRFPALSRPIVLLLVLGSACVSRQVPRNEEQDKGEGHRDVGSRANEDRESVASQSAGQDMAATNASPQPAEPKGRNDVAQSPMDAIQPLSRTPGVVGVVGGILTVSPSQAPMATEQVAKMSVHGLSDADGFNAEAYAHVAETGLRRVLDQPLSTFSIDVDTASYSNVRRFLEMGQLPPADAVRIEEMLNYFRYDDPPPVGAEPFSVTTEVASCPWAPEHRLLRIGLRGREIAQDNLPPRNLVFLLDVSGSMSSPDKLPLVKAGMKLLTETLRPEDRVGIVVYAGAAGLVLPMTPGDDRDAIIRAIDGLQPGGSTNGAEGIELAYALAEEGASPKTISRVILATDGDFNVGVTSEGELVRLIEKEREKGIFLTVLGFGTGNLKDSTMEKLADHGNGNYAYVDSIEEAHKILVREGGATLVTIAKDVKLQVEFNPAEVESYRLVGYENRTLAAEDFNDDRKDAGEIGAGHAVVALYEVVPAGGANASPRVDPLRYQAPPAVTPTADSGEIATIKLRWKRPDGDTSRLLARTVTDTGARIEHASDDLRFASAVAAFGMILRGSENAGTASHDMVAKLASSSLGEDPDGTRGAFVELAARARAMTIPMVTSGF